MEHNLNQTLSKLFGQHDCSKFGFSFILILGTYKPCPVKTLGKEKNASLLEANAKSGEAEESEEGEGENQNSFSLTAPATATAMSDFRMVPQYRGRVRACVFDWAGM